MTELVDDPGKKRDLGPLGDLPGGDVIVWVDQAGNALANNVVGGGNPNPTATADSVSVTKSTALGLKLGSGLTG